MTQTPTDALRLVPDDQLAALIQQADDGFGYSMEMVRLVDGVRTYRLKIEGQETIEITDGEDNDYQSIEACYALVKAAKNKVRADAIRTALAAPASPLPGGGPTCQLCANKIEGWICQGCGSHFYENDAGALVLNTIPAAPTGDA